jgi:hypothetical protein
MKYRTFKIGKNGWAPWTVPDMDNFVLGCCNCGSAHDVQFRVKEVVKRHKDGTMDVRDVEGDFVVEFRMTSNDEETRKLRQEMVSKGRSPTFPMKEVMPYSYLSA